MNKSPIEIFKVWYDEAVKSGEELPEAMHLATVDGDSPDIRTVLFKGIEGEDFLFFTNYNSSKAQQIAKNPIVSANFHWKILAKQVRIRGVAKKTTPKVSKDYFYSRPFLSQVAGLVSQQSQAAQNYPDIKKIFEEAAKKYENKQVPYPENWGGYAIKIDKLEFWTNHPNRFHERQIYQLQNGIWNSGILWP